MRLSKLICSLALLLVLLSALGCQKSSRGQGSARDARSDAAQAQLRPLPANSSPELKRVVEAELELTKQTTGYDATYVKIDYPGGDVPLEAGVCTDVVIRAFRKGGVDLQKEVHEDMQRNFQAYPKTWKLTRTDTNIDHRRVPNLMIYFERQGKSLPVTSRSEDYLPGDVVTWNVNGLPHIGMVTNMWSAETRNYLVVHNIGRGAQIENVLFTWPITGRFRYF
ncbi:MAG TPA: DUF1287 domain-containing protein [Pyrinomonadaceae bacterium]|jgi:hypothetical protein